MSRASPNSNAGNMADYEHARAEFSWAAAAAQLVGLPGGGILHARVEERLARWAQEAEPGSEGATPNGAGGWGAGATDR